MLNHHYNDVECELKRFAKGKRIEIVYENEEIIGYYPDSLIVVVNDELVIVNIYAVS